MCEEAYWCDGTEEWNGKDEPMEVPDADIPILKIIRASIFGALISLVVCVWLYWRR